MRGLGVPGRVKIDLSSEKEKDRNRVEKGGEEG